MQGPDSELPGAEAPWGSPEPGGEAPTEPPTLCALGCGLGSRPGGSRGLVLGPREIM